MLWLIRGVALFFALGIGIMLGQATGTTGSGSLASDLLVLCAPINEAHKRGFMTQDQVDEVLVAVFAETSLKRPKNCRPRPGQLTVFHRSQGSAISSDTLAHRATGSSQAESLNFCRSRLMPPSQRS